MSAQKILIIAFWLLAVPAVGLFINRLVGEG
jgi:hypothetical protein